MPAGSRRFALLVAGIVLVAFLPYRDVPSLSYCGNDTAVLVDVNRYEELADLWRPFGREIRDYVEPDVGFYRPWTGLSYVVDDLLHGVEARGYHVTDVLLHVTAALLLLLLLRSLGTGDVIAFAGASWFALHPLGVEVIPVPARRADLWTSVLLLAACWGRVLHARGRQGGRALWIVAGLLAPLSKETGWILPLLFVALPVPGPWWRRLASGCGLVVPALVMRWLALEGFGGYGTFTLRYRQVPPAVVTLLDPATLLAGWGGSLMTLLLAIGAVVVLARRSSPHGARADLVIFGVVWSGAMVCLAVLARGISAWYLYAPLPGVAVALAGLLSSWRRAGRVAVAMVMAPALLASPLWIDYREWREVSRQFDRWVAGSEILVSAAAGDEAGSAEPFLVAGLPQRVHLRPERRFHVRSASCFMDYTLSSALNLRTGVRPALRSIVRVDVNALDAEYVIQVDPVGDALRIGASGPVALRADIDLVDPEVQAWQVRRRSQDHGLEIRVNEQEDGTWLLDEIDSPLWIWDGNELRRFVSTP